MLQAQGQRLAATWLLRHLLSYYPLNRSIEPFIIGIRNTWENLETNSGEEWTKQKMYCSPYRAVLCTLKSNLRTFGSFPFSFRGKKKNPFLWILVTPFNSCISFFLVLSLWLVTIWLPEYSFREIGCGWWPFLHVTIWFHKLFNS